MRSQDRYVLSLTTAYAVTTFVLSFYGTPLDLYVSVFIVEYFIATLLHSPLNSKTQKITNAVGYVLFGIFLFIVAIKILQILGVTPL